MPDYEALYEAVAPSIASVYRDGERGAGSGFVYDETHLLTNEHVVRGVERVDVRFADGTWDTGTVVGVDEYTDLAVLRLADPPAAATPLPVASEPPAPGRPVAALGNPLGLEGSITTGVVSGRDRSMPTAGGFSIPDVVQTDAPINPGNSGGPLVATRDLTAESGDETVADERTDEQEYVVVGVNRARTGDGVGFAISPRLVTTVVPTLIDRGRYRHPYLRVRTLDVTPTIAAANGLDEPRGVLVAEVRGPVGGDRIRGATRVERRKGNRVPVGGDVIVGLAGHEVRSHEELTRLLMTEAEPDEPVTLDVIRDGRRRTLTVRPAVRPVSGDDRGVPIDVS